MRGRRSAGSTGPGRHATAGSADRVSLAGGAPTRARGPTGSAVWLGAVGGRSGGDVLRRPASRRGRSTQPATWRRRRPSSAAGGWSWCRCCSRPQRGVRRAAGGLPARRRARDRAATASTAHERAADRGGRRALPRDLPGGLLGVVRVSVSSSWCSPPAMLARRRELDLGAGVSPTTRGATSTPLVAPGSAARTGRPARPTSASGASRGSSSTSGSTLRCS